MDDLNVNFSSSTSNIILSSQNTIKSISLNILNNNNNINKEKIIENKNDNSYCDKDLNEKIVKLLIGDHPLLPIKTIEKIAYCNFMNQNFKNEDFYNIKVIDEIIHNENSHIVAEFKDYLIKGDISEFLQNYYKKNESLNLLPKIYEYYISCSYIFPNYVILPESKYIYRNIQKKQKVIDIQQEQEDKEENIKNGLIEQEKEQTVFNTQAIESILNQTDTSGIKQFFGVSLNMSKTGEEPEMIELVNNIEKIEKKINNKNNEINVCKLKKRNNNDILQYQNIMILNKGGYTKKFQNISHNKKNSNHIYERKNSGNNNSNNYNNEKIINKINLKNILRQNTDNNNNDNNNNNYYHKKRNIFSAQITYIDSCNNYMKNILELKGLESMKKINKNSKNIKENKLEKENEKESNKNYSQISSSLKNNNNSKDKNKGNNYRKYNQNYINNEDITESFNINQSIIKNIKKGRNNNCINAHHKENISRNKEILNFCNNIKNYFQNPFKNLTQSKNTISSNKTKSKNKHKSKGYQTTRNKYDNIIKYINLNKSNISKNHQSLDSEMNYNYIKNKALNQIQNKHNNLKNNLINALLEDGKKNQKKKIKKYKDNLTKENKDSIVNSIYLKNINNEENENLNINNQKQEEYNDNINNNCFLYKNNEKNNSKTNSQSKNRISSSISDKNNNKFSSAKIMSINSYRDIPKYSISNINGIIHKKQISMSKIPISFPENKILINKNKKNNNNNIIEYNNKNILKENNNNILDDYSSSKRINNINNSQTKDFNQEDYNNNINNNYIKPNSKSKNKRKNEIISSKNLKANNKIRNNIFNFEKKISKKLSEKYLNVFDKFNPKKSSNNSKTKKTSANLSNKSGKIKNNEIGPLSARESNNFEINPEMIELLTKKIQKIKQSIKETSDKGSNSISSIFKKKKIRPASNNQIIQGTKNSIEFIKKKTRNKNNNNLIENISSNSNTGINFINENLLNTIVNNILQFNLLSSNKKNLEYDELMKTFQKFKKPTNSFNRSSNSNNSNNSKSNYNKSNNSKNIGSKIETKRKKKNEKSKSIYSNNNYDNDFNIELNIKNNLGIQSKKSINNINNKIQNDNINSLNINFNNYTNNYNYNYNMNPNNINNANNGNIDFNSINYNNSKKIKGKSSSQKAIVGKNETNFKGIPINGFEKLINKKYNTRNYNIPMSVTDRIKQTNIYSSSIVNNNTNSYRYKNKNIGNTHNKIYYKNK